MGETVRALATRYRERVARTENTYQLLPRLQEPTPEEMEYLKESLGIEFFHIEPITYLEAVRRDPAHFWQNEEKYAESNERLRVYEPPAITVGLCVNSPALANGFDKSQLDQMRLIEKHSAHGIEKDTKAPGFREVMLPASAYAQADWQYRQRPEGQMLLPNFFARNLDSLGRFLVAHAGRFHPDRKFKVYWSFVRGHPRVGAVPAVVKVGIR